MRVLVIINKWWECDAALAAMLNDNARPPDSPWPDNLNPARPRPELAKVPNLNPVPRAIFPYKTFGAELWCVSDLLDSLSTTEQSSSEKKAERLRYILGFGEKPGLVIAVGTASAPEVGVNRNGGVTVGTSVFMHDGFPSGSNPESKLELPEFDHLIESTISTTLFEQIKLMDVKSALTRFLPVPLNPSPTVGVSIGLGDVALGTINVTNSEDYATKDQLTVQSFKTLGTAASPVSLETTHGLIRVHSGDCPFLFISGMVNRFQQFGNDVAPRQHAQNTAGAHNAGVVVSWMLSSLDKSGKLRRGSPGSSAAHNALLANDLEIVKARMTYAWSVWEFHARQRLSMFNYFLLIIGILINGYLIALKDGGLHGLLPALCLLGLIQCLVFAMIDWRNREMLYFADDLLQESEKKLYTSAPNEHAGPMVRRVTEETNRPFRYSKMKYWIRLTYGVIALGFLAALIDSIWLLICHRHPFS